MTEEPSWWKRVFSQGVPADWEDQVRVMQELVESQRTQLAEFERKATQAQALRGALHEAQSHAHRLQTAHEAMRIDLAQVAEDRDKWHERCKLLEQAQRRQTKEHTEGLASATEAARKQIGRYKISLSENKKSIEAKQRQLGTLKADLVEAARRTTTADTQRQQAQSHRDSQRATATEAQAQLRLHNKELERELAELRGGAADFDTQREVMAALAEQHVRRQGSDLQQLNTMCALTQLLTVFSAAQADLWGAASQLSLKTAAERTAQLRCMQPEIDWSHALKTSRLGEVEQVAGAAPGFSVRAELAAGSDGSRSQHILKGVDQLVTFLLQHTEASVKA